MCVDSQSNYVMWPSGNVFVVVAATLLYSFIFIAGFIGNSFIIITVLRWKEMKTPCNLLIMNIFITDLAVAVIAAAPLCILAIHWPFSDLMCKFLPPQIRAVVLAVGGGGGAAALLDRLSQTNQVCGLRIFIIEKICFLYTQLF